MYRKKGHLHFVGIGGIGMSGIAKILKYQGYTISGCDLDLDQPSIKDLLRAECTITQGHNTHLCNDKSIDVLVYSSAVNPSAPEIQHAQARGIPTIPRALMLAELMRTKFGIAIAGAHGKTTTTSLVGHILIEAKIDPTVIIGGHLKNISTNAQLGEGDFLVAEADESDRSLLHLPATIGVITNIDLEHLETYADLDDIKQTFIGFLNNLPFYGKAIVCTDDEHVRSILPLPHIKTIKYGLNCDADIQGADIKLEASLSTFNVYESKQLLGKIKLNMPGKHNILNALAATAVARDLGVPFETIAQALHTFKGIDRRFSYNGIFHGAEVFDDYGHHPKEISSTLTIARNRAKKRLVVIFQPHRYTRTKALWHEFIEAFSSTPVDQLIITDIYAASEAPIAHVTSGKLVQEIKRRYPGCKISYQPLDSDFAAIKHELANTLEENDLLLLLGAGNINRLADCIK